MFYTPKMSSNVNFFKAVRLKATKSYIFIFATSARVGLGVNFTFGRTEQDINIYVHVAISGSKRQVYYSSLLTKNF